MSSSPHAPTKDEKASAFVFHPILKTAPDQASGLGVDAKDGRDIDSRLEEAIGLAAAIDLEIIDAQAFAVPSPRPATLMGAGKVAEIAARLDQQDPRPQLVIIDSALTPVQHRNLEKEWNVKVLDRTALILEIFGARAQTAEGRLQVDLAYLTFQRSRLVRSWTHLERQRGGAGFLGGPGERQIESDRRALSTKIDRLKAKLEQVKRTRNLQRAKRKRAPYPVVALVGYTNAGKSTLFNRLTKSGVFAKDLLFATLDPTMRAVDLPSGERVVMSDTVGFISNLPTHLVAAFRATLEEVLSADIIVHVRDAAHTDSMAQRADVIDVLATLGINEDDERPVIEALNKADLLDEEDCLATRAIANLSLERVRQEGARMTLAEPAQVVISAATGEGVDGLCDLIDEVATRDRDMITIALKGEFGGDLGAARAFLYARGDVLDDQEIDDLANNSHLVDGQRAGGGEGGRRLTVRMSEKAQGQFLKAFPAAIIEPAEPGQRRMYGGR